jgi:hypothetical protein
LPSDLNLEVKNCLPNDNWLHETDVTGYVTIVIILVILLKNLKQMEKLRFCVIFSFRYPLGNAGIIWHRPMLSGKN